MADAAIIIIIIVRKPAPLHLGLCMNEHVGFFITV